MLFLSTCAVSIAEKDFPRLDLHNISDFGFAVSTKKDDEDDVDADVDQDGKIGILLFCLLT